MTWALIAVLVVPGALPVAAQTRVPQPRQKFDAAGFSC